MIDYSGFVRKHYDAAVRLNKTANSELKNALRSNERVPVFIDNLAIELKKVQAYRVRTRKKPFKLEQMASLVYDMT